MSEIKKNTVTIEEVKANMQDVFVTTIQAHDKPVTFVEVRKLRRHSDVIGIDGQFLNEDIF